MAGDCRMRAVVGAMIDRLYIVAIITMTCALMLGLLWITEAMQ
jgi:hypothetical protein